MSLALSPKKWYNNTQRNPAPAAGRSGVVVCLEAIAPEEGLP